MGYTHYFTSTGESKFNPEAKKIITKLLDKGFKDKLITLEYNNPSTPIVTDDIVQFNGIEDKGHETFYFNIQHKDFAFCKTAGKPYDDIVTKVLLTIKHFHPDVDISSDGDMDGDDWKVANKWAQINLHNITKNSMSDTTFQDLVDEALVVKGKIKRIEAEVVSDLKDLLKKLSDQILEKMKDNKMDGVSGNGGQITLVTRKGNIKYDVEQLMSDLGLTDLTKYENRGKDSKFLKYNLDT